MTSCERLAREKVLMRVGDILAGWQEHLPFDEAERMYLDFLLALTGYRLALLAAQKETKA